MKKFVAILTASMLLASSMNMGEAYSMGLNGVYMDVTATDTDAPDVSTTETTEEVTTEATTQATTEAVTEQKTTEQKTTEKSTEKVTEQTTTEKATEGTTEATTEEAVEEYEAGVVLDATIESEDYNAVDAEKANSDADRIHYLKLNGDSTQSSGCTIIESNGHFGIIDTSNRYGETQYGRSIVQSASDVAVIEYLAALGVTHLDFVLVTHDHSDHNGGVKRIAELNLKDNEYYKTDVTTTVEEFDSDGNKTSTKTFVNDSEDTSDLYTELAALNIVDSNTTYIYKTFIYNAEEEKQNWENKRYYDMAWQAMSDAGAVHLTVDNPSAAGLGSLGAAKNTNGSGTIDDTITFRFQDFNINLYNLYINSSTDENANSIVTYVEKSGVKTLLLADIDLKDDLEKKIGNAVVAQHGTVNVMSVAHHGYQRSTSKDLVNTLSPKYAVIQTADGELSSYSPFYELMKNKGVTMYRTLDQSSKAIVEDLTSGLNFRTSVFTDPAEPVLIRTITKTTVASEEYTAEKKVEKTTENTTAGTDNNANGNADSGKDAVEILTKTIKTTVESKISRTKNVWVNSTAPTTWTMSGKTVGWVKWYTTWDDYNWVYVNANGSHQQGFVETNGQIYYVENDSMIANCEKNINGGNYYFDSNGRMARGWYYRNKSWYLYGDDGVAYNGWIQSGSDWYFCDSKGKCVTGGYNCNGTNYVFDSDGKMLYGGWTLVNGNWYYANGDGTAHPGWMLSGGHWYYMDGYGKMVTGWVYSGGEWYYMRGSGDMATGWVNDGGYWYYLDSSGAMKTGWQYINGTWYYMWGSGAMAEGWVYSGGWYYMSSGSGAMVSNGWVYSGGKWYYMSGSGAMVTGSRNINGTVYYFDGNGAWYE